MTTLVSAAAQLPVLVVEDEAVIRLGLSLAIEAAGVEVHEAASAEEAIALLQSGLMVAAVVTDLRVPGRMDGRGLVAWIREHRPDIPIIVASGYPSDLDGGPALEVSAVISKPYDAADVVAALVQVAPSSVASAPDAQHEPR
jgi:CheY-like chemotaxis protein